MPIHKVRYTLWIDEEVLRAAKTRAADEGVTPSKIIVAVARMALIDAPQNAEARILQAVERTLITLQRIDRRRGYDHQVLKEMVGLMVQSFFNHTPAIPEKDKKAALHSGKARFNRFLDALAANLRGGQSILNDLPAAQIEVVVPKSDSISEPTPIRAPVAVHETESARVTDKHLRQPERSTSRQTNDHTPAATSEKRWTLFG